MWLFALFDLPVETSQDKREYVLFRTELLKEGFTMIQYSVYARYFGSEESAEVHRKRIKEALPPDGHVRLLGVTDHQFGKMEIYFGKKRVPVEEPPTQLALF